MTDTQKSDDAFSAARALLRWYIDAGVDEAVTADALNNYESARSAKRASATPPPAATPAIAVISSSTRPTADEAIMLATRLSKECRTIEELERAVGEFQACPLRGGAKNTCFGDGIAGAELLVIGEAPGRDEDAVGRPFVGRAGKLLDKMLAGIGRSRTTNTFISNVVYWRPPGNRAPTLEEIAICRPFVDRLIEIAAPKAIMLAGGTSMQALTGVAGIMRMRGQWSAVETKSGVNCAAMPVFHPAFLLRQPAQKRLAWADLQALAGRLREP